MSTTTDLGPEFADVQLDAFARRWIMGLEPKVITYDIMFDIDDVLIPTIDSIHQLALEAGLHDGSVTPKWAGWEAYGCDEQTYWNLWTQWADQGGYVNTPPIPEAAEALRRLAWAGHRIHLVTARGFMAHAEEIRAWTHEWVQEFAIPHHSLTFSQDKAAAMAEILTPNKIHAEIYRDAVRFDYAIDDSPKNVRGLLMAGVRAYLLDHHHNAEETNLPRVPTVSAFADLILEAS